MKVYFKMQVIYVVHYAPSKFTRPRYNLQMCKSSYRNHCPRGEGGTRIIFWRSVRPEVQNPFPCLRIFLAKKKKKKKKKKKTAD